MKIKIKTGFYEGANYSESCVLNSGFFGSMLIPLFFILCLSSFQGFAQSSRKQNREGMDHYAKKEYEAAENSYKRALKKDDRLLEASYNLGLAYYKQGKYREALSQYKELVNQTSDKNILTKIYHNLGNSYLQMNQLQESIEAYKNSLRLNPKDEDTRYNLTYAIQKLKARQQNSQNDSKDLLDRMENEEQSAQQYMRRNKNLGKEVKNW